MVEKTIRRTSERNKITPEKTKRKIQKRKGTKRSNNRMGIKFRRP